MATRIAEMPITNKKLKSYTDQIYKQGLNIKKSFNRIAVILSKIEESKCYEQDGFESVQDYADKILGWKKATTYQMLRIGRDYIDGKTFETVLPHGENDYSTSQIQMLLPLKSVDKAIELASENIINPDMTVKEIREIVKSYTGKGKVADADSESTSKSETTNEDSDDTIIDVDGYKTEYEIKLAVKPDGEKIIVIDNSLVDGNTWDFAGVVDLLNSWN